jgi:putative transcriptional regulator, XRE family
MPLNYKIDVLTALKNAGYTTYKIRKEKLLSESTVQKLRNKQPVAWENIATICKLLNCQPGDILEYEKD